MKVRHHEEPLVRFGSLDAGEVFTLMGATDVLMRTTPTCGEALHLQTGEVRLLDSNDMVQYYPDAELVLGEAGR
jgi:hypothetical protein